MSGDFSTRFYMQPAGSNLYFSVRILTPDNTASYERRVTFTKFRIIVATASSIVNGRQQGRPVPDVKDYESVRQYYNLPE